MITRGICFTVRVLLAATFCLSFGQTGWAADNRPNILWLVSDDVSPDFGCYGAPLVQTPHIDRLASEGVRYELAFTTAPVCSASRSAFFTGMYQTSIGAHNHRSHRGDSYRLPEGVRHLCQYLKRAGYFTTTTIAHKEFGSNRKTDYNFAYNFKELFEGKSWQECPTGKPFFAYCNFKEPHRGFVKPSAVENPVDPAKVQLPPYYVDHAIAREDWAAYLNSIEVLDRKIGKVLEQLEKDGLADNTVVIFFGDHGRPHIRGKQFLYDGGIRVPLIIRWPGHPDLVKPGSVNRDLVSAIDITATTLKLAGIDPPANMQGQVFLGPDATKRRYIYAARDRCDGTVDRIRCVRDKRFKYIRNFMPERPYTQLNAYKERSYPVLGLMRHFYRDGKLNPVQARFMVEGPRPAEELYDLDNDPHELHNLANDLAYKETLQNFRGRLATWIKETGDHGETPEDPAVVKKEYEAMVRKYEARTDRPMNTNLN